MSIVDGNPLPCVSEMRLLGLVIDQVLSWCPMVLDIEQRCRSKIWSLLKLREAGADIQQLVTLYTARLVSGALRKTLARFMVA